MTSVYESKRTWRQEHLADLEHTISLLERLTTIVERDVVSKEFPNLIAQHIGLAHLRVAETASRLAQELHLTTY
jgi:hypothetical protein